VIDLGEGGGPGAAGPAGPGGTGSVDGWVLWRRRARWPAAFAVVVVVLLGLAGSAARPAGPRLLWRLSTVNSFDVTRGTLYADDPVARRLVAYQLSDGVARWHREEPVDPQFFLEGGELMITVTTPSGESHHARLDPDTGATTLLIEDGLLGIAPDGSVILQSGDDHVTRLIVAPPTGGGRRVAATVPYPAWWILTPDNRELTWVSAAGMLHLVDLLTGAEQVRDTGLRAPASPTDATEPPIVVTVVRDALVVTARAGETLTVAAFARTDLARRWVRTFARVPLPNGEPSFGTAYACGPLACVPAAGTAGRTGTDLVDPADGRLARHVNTDILVSGESRWQLVPATGDAQMLDLFDVETGTRAHLGWERVADLDPQRYLMSRARRDATDFGVFDVATGRLTRIGTLPGGYSGCKLDPPYLACLKPGADPFLGVWRVSMPTS
jgi:hypothetical protein